MTDDQTNTTSPTTHYFSWSEKPINEAWYMPLTTRCRGLVINRDGYRGLFNDGDIDKGTQFLLDKIDDSKLRTQDSTSLNILDLGCGSGIMPLWIMAYSEQKKIIPLPHIDACDISPLAVTCAQHNTEKYKNIKVILSDIMTNDYFHDKQYDLIITNPPFAAGKKTVREFFRQWYVHLAPGGQMRCVAPTNKWAKSHIAYCETIGSVTVVSVERWWRVWYIQK